MPPIILEHEECGECGLPGVELHTDVDQAKARAGELSEDGCAPGMDWYACDGDRVTCPECRATGMVSCDSESPARVVWDEEVPRG